MDHEGNNEIPPEAADWHPPAENTEPVAVPVDHSTRESDALVGQDNKSLERVSPTPENPIQEIRIGLQHTLGMVTHPTRIVMIMKDGSSADMPWEQAEAILPPEYRVARELGEKALELQRFVGSFETAIRAGTDVMKPSGHMKDAVLKLAGQRSKSLQYLQEASDLFLEVGTIRQESFLELRRMTNARESHAEQLRALSEQLEECEHRFDALREKISADKPEVIRKYEWLTETPSAQLASPKGQRPELSDSNES